MNDLTARIKNDFSFHPATEDTAPKHDQVREICRNAALQIVAVVPAGREQSLALTHLEQAMMWGNAGIAREDTKYPPVPVGATNDSPQQVG